MGAKILVIDDEVEIRRLLKVGLTAHGYDFLEAATGQDGIYLTAVARPDIVLLDMGLPDLDGLSVVKQIREWSQIPIIILSVRGQDQDKVNALDLGADDYLTKPFSMSELMARIRVAMRHQGNLKDEPTIQIADLWIDLARRQVKVGGTEVHLTPTEYDLLKILISNAGKVVTHRYLLTNIWGNNGQEYAQYLRIYISQLRKKIEKDPNQPKYILTEPGVGYRLAVME
ncbi:MAG: response regulator [Syntrophomonadaceae bacterium]|nr:response regulator [Syntrophomonadaceae bacterium]